MASLLPSALARIDALKAEIVALRPLDPDSLGRAMQRLRLEWTYHSNAIEGNSLDYGETRALLMHGVTAHGKPLKDHLDIRRHREVIEYLEAMVRENEPLTLAVVRELHRMLMGDTYEVKAQTPDGGWVTREETGGAYKTHANHVVTRTGETHYYATPEETPARMTDLMDAVAHLLAEVEAGDTHPLVAAATLHHGLVEIHPFADGNGRLARVLMNLLMMRGGYPPAVLRTEHRDAYYGALAEADAGSLDAFIAFVADEMAETMVLYLRALRGEPDPDAFSKRVAILQREAETQASEVFDLKTRAVLARDFLVPLCAATDRRADQLSHLFAHSSRTMFVTDSEGKPRVGPQAKTCLEQGDWVRVRPHWDFRGLRSNPQISISIYYDGIVGDSLFVLRTGLRRDSFTCGPEALPRPDFVDRILDMAFDPIMEKIEKAIRKE